jgi:hypothetical protein
MKTVFREQEIGTRVYLKLISHSPIITCPKKIRIWRPFVVHLPPRRCARWLTATMTPPRIRFNREEEIGTRVDLELMTLHHHTCPQNLKKYEDRVLSTCRGLKIHKWYITVYINALLKKLWWKRREKVTIRYVAQTDATFNEERFLPFFTKLIWLKTVQNELCEHQLCD